MGATFVLMLREGLEAALIVGILLAYLASIDRRDGAQSIWFGVGLAVVASGLAAFLLFLADAGFEGKSEQIFEGLSSLTAVVFLTWMIFWMRRNAINLKRTLHARLDRALNSQRTIGLAAVAFIVVVREGIESALFLFATIGRVGVGGGTLGAVLGLATAIALGIAIYKGGVRLNLSLFFTLTGTFLLIVAAGLTAFGLHELIEAGVIPSGIDNLWDIRPVLPDDSGLGAFLKHMFGYNADPALVEIVCWGAYLLVVGSLFFRPLLRSRRARVATA
jgi:high-affinity iron transporter